MQIIRNFIRSLVEPSMVRLSLGAVLLALAIAAPAAAHEPDVVISIKDHRFVPAPSAQKVRITFRNEDSTTSEFESVDFHGEKVVQPSSAITVFVGPLDHGATSSSTISIPKPAATLS